MPKRLPPLLRRWHSTSESLGTASAQGRHGMDSGGATRQGLAWAEGTGFTPAVRRTVPSESLLLLPVVYCPQRGPSHTRHSSTRERSHSRGTQYDIS